MKFSQLVEHVSKKAIPPYVKHLIVEVMVSDEEGEDVEVCALPLVLLGSLNKPINRSHLSLSESNVHLAQKKSD